MKPGINAHLDVARKVFSQTVEDIYSLQEKLAAECMSTVTHCQVAPGSHRALSTGNAPTLSVQYTEARGFHFSVKTKDAEQLPSDGQCVQVVQFKKKVAFTTDQLASLNARSQVRCKLLEVLRISLTSGCPGSSIQHIPHVKRGRELSDS